MGKLGTQHLKCWYCFDHTYQEVDEHVAATIATSSSEYDIDTNWYMDSRAADHLTNELDKLTDKEKYQGKDKVQVVNGSSLSISHIGHSHLSTPNHTL